jgi:hypothetical protein
VVQKEGGALIQTCLMGQRKFTGTILGILPQVIRRPVTGSASPEEVERDFCLLVLNSVTSTFVTPFASTPLDMNGFANASCFRISCSSLACSYDSKICLRSDSRQLSRLDTNNVIVRARARAT